MLNLTPIHDAGRPLRILCVGAHADDLEIGCGGTVLDLIARRSDTRVRWVVLSAEAERRAEAKAGAAHFLAGASDPEILLGEFRDGYFPYLGSAIKDFFESLKDADPPDLILTHYRHDLHQDHRIVSDLTWNTFRDHLILEYEIPKYDGDLGVPNFFVPLSEAVCDKKVDGILESFPSQGGRYWFSRDTFRSLMRLRGVEARSKTGHAEAFHARKVTLDPGRTSPLESR